MKSCITSLLFFTLLFSLPVGAKKYPFKIDTSREVVISRSSKAGTKMVEVTAYGRTADKAIEQAMMDAALPSFLKDVLPMTRTKCFSTIFLSKELLWPTSKE